jgi:hypothetical protein
MSSSICQDDDWGGSAAIEVTSPSLGSDYITEGQGGFHLVKSAMTTSQNLFWITKVDDESKKFSGMNLPLYGYAKEVLIPSFSGTLTIEELMPDWTVEYFEVGEVTANEEYHTWFYANSPGTHRQRYKINNGPASGVLTFNVIGQYG